MQPTDLHRDLLDWYDRHARALPWRVPPGANHRADPYAVWLSEVMLQQTTVATVKRYFTRFLTLWPDVAALAAADRAVVLAEWAGLGYYTRARKLHECAQAVVARGGFPTEEAELLALPGIGPYTAAAIAAIAFDRPAVVVDGNIERVMSRLERITTPLPAAKPLLRAAAARHTPQHRPGDHAQALMDLGATICTPRNPACTLCPLRPHCQGVDIAAQLPCRQAKSTRPERHAQLWCLFDAEGRAWAETRPDKGLLGGMLGLPSSDWMATPPPPLPPLAADWQVMPSMVRHVFTHFTLTARVWVAHLRLGQAAPVGLWLDEAQQAALPTLFQKALRVARQSTAKPRNG